MAGHCVSQLEAGKLTLRESTQGKARKRKKSTTYVDALCCDSLANTIELRTLM